MRPTRTAVLDYLRECSHPAGVAEIAEALGIHANTVRFHLEALVGTGQVARTTAGDRRPGRPPLLFTAVRRMDPTGPRHYRMLAEVLVASLAGEPDPRPRAVEAGRRWGRRLASDGPSADTAESIARLVGLLDELGFSPELVEDGELPGIGLRHCPFLELAETSRQVVCPIHLGLMHGAMESWGSPVAVAGLDAFVRPDLCLTHLTPTGAS